MVNTINEILEEIREELAEVGENYMTPPQRRFEGEVTLGTLSDELKNLYTLREQYRQKNNEGAHVFAKHGIALPNAAETGFKTELLDGLLWLSIVREFGLQDRVHVGLRAGWEVVSNDVIAANGPFSPYPKEVSNGAVN